MNAATCFIAPVCSVIDTPLPPVRPARPLMLAETSHYENLPPKPSSRPRPEPIARIQWRREGGDECEQRTPSLGEERHTYLTVLSGYRAAVDNQHSLGLSCPGFPGIGILLTGHPTPLIPAHRVISVNKSKNPTRCLHRFQTSSHQIAKARRWSL